MTHKELDDMNSVALVITSCKRHDLLFQTLNSFVEKNTYPINQIIVIEDSALEIDKQLIIECTNKSNSVDYSKCEVIIINNRINLGQMKSIDKAYEKVTSEYIFHCEDDWEFIRSCFIEDSLEILANDKKIFTVWLRAKNDLAGHEISKEIESSNSKIKYYKIIPRGVWSGFTLNPGLRRKKDCFLLHPYSQQKKVDNTLKNRKGVTESDLSILYGNLGFGAAVTSKENGYIRHIGDGYHITNEWENSIVVKTKNVIKRVIKRIIKRIIK